ncbi:MAG TPA: HEAT repeat domain-containing protein, partial [Planctomycetota bacterium]|nr:HEAT repeat domain-containing protein [Planctomycetota bacterium]
HLTVEQIRNRVTPLLLLGLHDLHADARAGAVIALGKVGRPERDDYFNLMVRLLEDDDRIVRESACLAMGALGYKDAAPLLLKIYRNDPSVRVKGVDVPNRQRSFAAMAIGLLGSRNASNVDRGIVDELIAGARTPQASEDLQVSAAIALGVMRAPSAVPALVEIVKDEEQKDKVRCHATVALGKLGDRSAVPFLVKCLTDRKTDVQRSAAIALGLLVDKEDRKSVDALIETAKSAADRAVRNFAVMALGRIGSTAGRDFIASLISRGHGLDQTFGALAAGVHAVEHKGDSKAELGKLVFHEFVNTRADGERGAYAIALGLLDYQEALPKFVEELKAGGSPDLKAYVCIACGLLGARSPEVLKLIQDEAKQIKDLDVQRRASIALGLCQDPQAVKVLEGVIKSASSNLSALGAASMALGFIGDVQAVPILGTILENKDGSSKDNARAFAAVGLGLMGDKDDYSILTVIQQNSNYLAQTEALAEVLTIY